MSETPSIATIVDLLREILYDILGLFLPGAAFLLILKHSSIWVLHSLADAVSKGQDTKQIAIFVGASYVSGYAIQGVSATVWIPIVRFFGRLRALPGKLRILSAKVIARLKTPPAERSDLSAKLWQKVKDLFKVPEPAPAEVTGVGPAGLQTKDSVQKSELFKALREQVSEYCKLDKDKVSVNEVQNLSFSVAGDRSANAFRFSFRADLCAGMFVVFFFGSVITIIESLRASAGRRAFLLTALIYALLSFAFYLRAKFYYNIRGRIIYTIALVVLAELRSKKDESKGCVLREP